MSAPHLSLVHLVRGLERYGEKYEVLEVFADDVEELYALNRGQKLPPALGARASGKALAFKVDGKSYRLSVSENSGFVRLTRATDADGESDFTMLGRIIGRTIGLAFASKGEGWPGLIMGVLAGGIVDAQPPERAIAVRYDPHSQEWRAYGGPMSIWMRQQAAAS
jgi:hypothetical protein